MSWDGWEPRAGMVGYVIHIWRPNHPNKMYRTPLNRDVYLIEIGKNYVPVTASGLRQYNQAMDSNQKEIETSRRNSLQREMIELRQQQNERGLTPILGSSLESPTSLMAEGGRNSSFDNKSKIQAVSSSSSEDESCLLNLEKERQEDYLRNLWEQVIEQEQNIKDEIESVTATFTNQHVRDQLSINTNTDKTAIIKNQTIHTQISNKQAARNDEHDRNEEELFVDSNNVCCAKELVDQLVDHVVDTLCEPADLEVDVDKTESLEQDSHVKIIEVKDDENTKVLKEDEGELSIEFKI